MEGELVGMFADAVPHALVVISVISLGTGWGKKKTKQKEVRELYGVILGLLGGIWWGKEGNVGVSLYVNEKGKAKEVLQEKGAVQ